MNLLLRCFDLLVYASLWSVSISALGMISCYAAVALSNMTSFDATSFVMRTSRWSVRLAWTGTIAFAIGLIVFLLSTVADYIIHGDQVG